MPVTETPKPTVPPQPQPSAPPKPEALLSANPYGPPDLPPPPPRR